MKAVVCSNTELRVLDRPEPVLAKGQSVLRSCAAASAALICMSAITAITFAS